MNNAGKPVNLVLSGGGIKGIAFLGALEVVESKGYRCANIAGVSVGALVGALSGAGYRWFELKETLSEINFADFDINAAVENLPVVTRYSQFCNQYRGGRSSIERFLNCNHTALRAQEGGSNKEFTGYRGNFFKNLVTFSKEGCLFDGDYLEEWVYSALAKKGIRTFADLRGPVIDNLNPRGYKVRMTAVDANRGKIVVLPDDIAFYGMDPDRLEVARAVRMSTSVPFAFKPVELHKKEGDTTKTYHLVDGGVLDNFPVWLIASSPLFAKIGLILNGEEKKKMLNLNTPLNIYKSIVIKSYNTGIPQGTSNSNIHIIKIPTSKVSFLDFGISEENKQYLYTSGKEAALKYYDSLEPRKRRQSGLYMFLKFLFGKRFF